MRRAPWWTVPLASLALAVAMVPLIEAAPAAKTAPKRADPRQQGALAGLQWRSIGPYRGGRVTAVTGVVGQRNVYYFGGTGGGVWRSEDSGVSWSCLTDGQLGTGSVGAIAVAESDANLIYVGMGEACIRGNASHGDGIYRSVDGGRTWQNLGLKDTRHIGRIRVHPRDPDLVYVAALGHSFGPNRERGVFRSRDGGRTWQHVLVVNDSTGAVDLSMDPGNPRVLYAATWQVNRTPWSLESGGLGSGLWKTTDGGDTWNRLTGEGLPKGIWGRVGVSVSPVRSSRVYAAVEAAEGGVFRSDDGGRTWRRTNEDRDLRQRAWYYTHIHADPGNADGVYVQNVYFTRSIDGGRGFTRIRTPHGDSHDLWIDPRDPMRMIEGNDGGANITFDGGLSWTRQDNQPTAQFYHVVTDGAFPYNVYGAQQDNSTISIASRTGGFGIGPTDWHDVGGGESGSIAPKPGNPDVVYAGSYGGHLTRYDHRTGQKRNIHVHPDNPMGWGAEGAKYRFQWTFPIVASPHDSNTLYATSNVVHRTTNEGQSWRVISPDLTRNDPAKLAPSGGPITKDNTSVEYYCTIFAFAESPQTPGLLWAGSDDGKVHVTRDGGENWTDVTPPSLPPWSTISQIDPGRHDPATAYVAAYRYKLDDYGPYAFVTHDYGRRWSPIVGDLPHDGGFVRVVREDPVRRGLLYAGTETGVYWSPDDGRRWFPLRVARPGLIQDLSDPEGEIKGALPLVPITDLVVQGADVVVSTQGRAFWILDDVTPLREIAGRGTNSDTWLYPPAPAYRFGGPAGNAGTVGMNPARYATIYYRLEDRPKDGEDVTLEFLDAGGKLVRKLSSKKPPEGEDASASGAPAPPVIPAKAGLNRFTWDLRYPEASRFKGLILWIGAGLAGPQVVPGRYQVRLTVGGKSQTQPLELRGDPRLATTSEEYQRQFDLRLKIRDKLTETHDAIVRLRDVRDQAKAVAERAKTASGDTTTAAASKALAEKLTAIEEALYQTKNKSSQDPLNYPIRLNNKLSSLANVVESADSAPTDQSVAVYEDLAGRIDAELKKLKTTLDVDLAEFNRRVRELNVPAVVAKEKKESTGR